MKINIKYKIWSKIKSLTRNDLDPEPVYNNKSLKNKVKFYKHVIKTDFHNNELLPKKIFMHSSYSERY